MIFTRAAGLGSGWVSAFMRVKWIELWVGRLGGELMDLRVGKLVAWRSRLAWWVEWCVER